MRRLLGISCRLLSIVLLGALLTPIGASPAAAAATSGEITPKPIRLSAENVVEQSGRISGNGTHLLYETSTAFNENTLWWVDLTTGRTQFVDQAFSDFSDPIHSARISDDGRYVAYADTTIPTVYQVRLWDATSGTAVALSGASGDISSVQMSGNGSTVVWNEGPVDKVWSGGRVTTIADCGRIHLTDDGRVLPCTFGGRRLIADVNDDATLALELGASLRILRTADWSVLGRVPRVQTFSAYSGDGLSATFYTLQSLVPTDQDNATSPYLYRADTDTIQLINLPFTPHPVTSLSDDGTIGVVVDSFDKSLWLLDFSDPFPEPLPVEVMKQRQLSAQVRRLYLAYYLRQPDPSGLGFWVRERSRGTELVAVSDAFATSAEFVNRYGTLTDGQFIDLVYRNVLGRAPDQQGRRFWLASMAAGTTRAELMVGFSESTEFSAAHPPPAADPDDARIWRLYLAYFLRPADQDGFDFWAMQVWMGASVESVSDAFAGSAEFVNRYGALDDASFVNLVYRNVLGRPADPQGAAFWRAQLAAGATRGEMMLAFSDSPEYIRQTDSIPPW